MFVDLGRYLKMEILWQFIKEALEVLT